MGIRRADRKAGFLFFVWRMVRSAGGPAFQRVYGEREFRFRTEGSGLYPSAGMDFRGKERVWRKKRGIPEQGIRIFEKRKNTD